MTKIALLGAGGKMGVRLSKNLQGSRFDVAHVEVSPEGQARLLDEVGVACVDRSAALAGAEVVVLAVPDRLIGKILHQFIDEVETGTVIVMLDAAAPHAGELPEREDVSYFITHPCHPPLFNDETDLAAKKDYFGGVAAKQHIVCALMQGPEEHYALGEEVARTIYKPVMRAHRCTVEAIAILEPALSETIGATLSLALREATDEAVRRGVPKEAARDFMLGHLNIELSIAFEEFPEGKFSDGALQAIAAARPVIFKENWLDAIFAPEAVLASVKEICNPPGADS
ncbi:phosphogluconate dehydrogenase C-terminal domain-containing protein [Devosia sp. YIM 151766]|uniref:phosphogluconate dehydrogenase C-terminal domain-containing protein n=1 Tax=Devosia sp. YIM 151766 TaxID=3017325 RepID=UPI00255CC5D3|nr:phosphogluconate dehydrogenase C-terminal domain-containing protein [Devosia sp. YIM 151766]WIY52149.1 phosphogluconate dehydrogenase C-terminal domain-containing protein [Devosia sp. YIM 151766]